MTKARKLSRASREALDQFDAAAQGWGWDQDQGSSDDAAASNKRYISARTKLERRIMRLEARIEAAKPKHPPGEDPNEMGR